MQQPSAQYSVELGHGLSASQRALLPGQTAVPLHEVGSVEEFWPGQRMQSLAEQGAPQAAFFTHGEHFAALWMFEELHSGVTAGLVITSTQPAPSHIVQHPKQSHPGGASGAQN